MRFLTLVIVVSAPIALSQTTRPGRSSVVQKAGECALNIEGNNNLVGSLTCIGIDVNLAKQMQQLVNGSKGNSKALAEISAKLDTMLKERTGQSQNQTQNVEVNLGPSRSASSINQQGGITAGTIGQVLMGPPRANLRFTEEMANATNNGEVVMNVHIFTDRSIPGAVIGLVFSGPVKMGDAQPSMKGAGLTQFSWGQISSDGTDIPNSVAVSVNAPAAFQPGQELIIPVKSIGRVHVVGIAPIGN